MRQLKSKAKDLRNLFSNVITVEHIAETFEACEGDRPLSSALAVMQERDFDVYGVCDKGRVIGYVEKDSDRQGTCLEAARRFDTHDLVSEATPILDVMKLLRDTPRLFVLERNHVRSIVTRGDLQKAPVRMLLLSLVTLLEMQMLRLVRHYYLDESWRGVLNQKRLEKAQCLFKQRQKRNEAIGLADCLQFADKRDLLLKHPTP